MERVANFVALFFLNTNYHELNEFMENQKFGTLDVEPIDVEELKKLSKEEIEAMWEEASHLQWKE